MAETNKKLDNPHAGNVAPQHLTIAGANVILHHKGPKLAVQKNANEISVNVEKYPTQELAVRDGAFKAAELSQTKGFIAADPKKALEVFNTNKDYSAVLRLIGIKRLSDEHGKTLEQIKKVKPETLSISEQFTFACEHYLFTGSLPEGLTKEVVTAFNAIPKSARGLHLLDEIASEEYDPNVNIDLYNYIKATHADLKAQEKILTKEFNYKPQVGTGEEEPLDPKNIETKVTPFYGGYYRGYVCRYAADQRQIVQEQQTANKFQAEDFDGLDDLKKYTYETVYNPNKDNLLELPYNAYPLPDSLNPQNKFEIFRTESGSFYLKPKQGTDQPKKKIAVKFDFVLKQTPENSLQDEPVGQIETIGTQMDSDSEQFIQTLSQNIHLTNSEKAKRCAEYVRKRFKYPENEDERNQMNQRYLSAGDNVLKTIAQHGITDCYWSNIFCGELLHRLGIHHRVIAGHYVTKDPRFDFAAVAGTGHAWGEIWTGEEWIKDGIDATPSKQKEKEEKDDEKKEQQEGDFGGAPSEEQTELDPDEIRTLFEELLKSAAGNTTQTPDEIFEKKTGISLERWKQIEAFIKNVNNTPVPADTSIKGKPSTIGQEWDEIFKLIYKKREIPVQSFRGPVRRSEAEGVGELEDPVDAVIDLLSGESDPLGYKITAVKTRQETHILEFEDDAILDLTASMAGTPAEEQKKMLLSGLYNLMQTNRRLNLDKYKRNMKAPLTLRSRVLSFKGDDLVSQLHDSNNDIDEKALSKLFDELGKTKMGTGNLVGALRAYENKLDQRALLKVGQKQMVKMLTIVSDGGVNEKEDTVQIIKRLREKGIIVQGIGFGDAAQDIRVICHDPANPDAGVALTDVRQAVPTRHKMLARCLRKM